MMKQKVKVLYPGAYCSPGDVEDWLQRISDKEHIEKLVSHNDYLIVITNGEVHYD